MTNLKIYIQNTLFLKELLENMLQETKDNQEIRRYKIPESDNPTQEAS